MGEQRATSTTKAQVSGHKFFQRRIALGLVIGDERLIHDPLSRRNRAFLVGLIACVMAVLAALLFGIISPQRNPGLVDFVIDEHGQLYIRQEQVFHPVANVASARLILGEPSEPEKISTTVLAEKKIGLPVGIPDAPRVVATHTSPQVLADAWYACVDQSPHHLRHSDRAQRIIIGPTGEEHLSVLGEGFALLARADGGDYIILSEQGKPVRRLIPSDEDFLGRILRQRLGVHPDTPRWIVEPALLALIEEKPPYSLPLGTLAQHGESLWFLSDQQGVELSELQGTILRDAGFLAQRLETSIPATTQQRDPINLPQHPWRWVDPAGQTWCIQAKAQEESVERVKEFVFGRVEYSKDTVQAEDFAITLGRLTRDPHTATLVAGEPPREFLFGFEKAQAGTRVALSARGFHAVSESGVRHSLEELTTAQVLGVQEYTLVPWAMLHLLPEGSPLSAEYAWRNRGVAADESPQEESRK